MADSNEPDARAWRSLLAASAASKQGNRASELEWLRRNGDEYAVAADAPEGVRALLDLYAPLCSSRADRPLAVAHLGQSLDGHIATASGDSYYITGPDNVRHLHRLRALSSAVVVGAGTIARDDPQLTVRHVVGPNPVRVVLDPSARLDASRRVFTDGVAPTLVVHAVGLDAPAPGNAEILRVPVDGGGLHLGVLLERLRERGLACVFVEGGGSTVSRFIEAGLLDRLHVAIAPIVTGSGRPGLTLPARERIAECLRPVHRVFMMGGDVLFDCDLRAAAPAAAGANGTLTRVL
ncbi:MAG TPA: RibD family protein [Gammaproteobacteria bacterium]|nr:RibD family protein [Gammaproteobacteria bacterium]